MFFSCHAVAIPLMVIRILSRVFSIRMLAGMMSRFLLSSYFDIFKYFNELFDEDELNLTLMSISQTFIELSFMEAVQGCTKTLTFQTDVLCNACGMLSVNTYFYFQV